MSALDQCRISKGIASFDHHRKLGCPWLPSSLLPALGPTIVGRNMWVVKMSNLTMRVRLDIGSMKLCSCRLVGSKGTSSISVCHGDVTHFLYGCQICRCGCQVMGVVVLEKSDLSSLLPNKKLKPQIQGIRCLLVSGTGFPEVRPTSNIVANGDVAAIHLHYLRL